MNVHQPQRDRQLQNATSHRTGSVLLMVLAVVAMLSLAAWTFCDLMVTETGAVSAYSRGIEQRLLVDSGIDWTRARLNRRHRVEAAEISSDGFQNPLAAGSIGADHPDITSAWTSVTTNAARGEFSIVHHLIDSNNFETKRGPFNLSGLINVNALKQIEQRYGRDAARRFLLALPTMTSTAADQILAQDKPFTTLEDINQLAGIDEREVFGEDIDNDFQLGPNEDSNGNRRLDVGWGAYLTTVGGESTVRPDGSKKINVNQDDLAALFDQLQPKFGPEFARYVIAFRMHGALSDWSLVSTQPSREQLKQDAIERGRRQLGELPERPGDGQLPNASKQSNPGTASERGGLNLAVGPVFRIESLVDLFGTSVRALVDGQDTIIASPWSNDANTLVYQLPRLNRDLTLSDDLVITGRINILHAPLAVLMSIPDVNWRIANAIIAGRQQEYDQPDSIGWLLDRRIVTHQELRRMAPFITVGGDYFRAVVVGQLDPISGQHKRRRRSVAAARISIDATDAVPRLMTFHELTSSQGQSWLKALPKGSTSRNSRRTQFAFGIDTQQETPILR